MKNFPILILIFSLSFLSLPLYGQEKIESQSETDHLQPLRPQFGVHRKYNLQVQNILFEGISDYQVIQFRIQPSFGGESVLVIEVDTANLKEPTFTLVYHKSKSSIWESHLNKDQEKVKIEKLRKPISKDDAMKIADLYSAALSKVCENNSIGLDGNSYFFSDLTKAGRTWLGGNITGKNKVEQLVLLSQELVSLIGSQDKAFRLNNALTQQIELLTNEFNEK